MAKSSGRQPDDQHPVGADDAQQAAEDRSGVTEPGAASAVARKPTRRPIPTIPHPRGHGRSAYRAPGRRTPASHAPGPVRDPEPATGAIAPASDRAAADPGRHGTWGHRAADHLTDPPRQIDPTHQVQPGPAAGPVVGGARAGRRGFGRVPISPLVGGAAVVITLLSAGTTIVLLTRIPAVAISSSHATPAPRYAAPAPQDAAPAARDAASQAVGNAPSTAPSPVDPASSAPAAPPAGPPETAARPVAHAPKPADRALPNLTGADLALNRPAIASGSQGPQWCPDYAVDGNQDTRWSSAFRDPSGSPSTWAASAGSA